MTDATPSQTPPTQPDEWKSGDDPMTDAQRVYLDTLARQAGEPAPDDDMSKATASEAIDELREKADLDEDDNPDIDLEDEPDINHEP